MDDFGVNDKIGDFSLGKFLQSNNKQIGGKGNGIRGVANVEENGTKQQQVRPLTPVQEHDTIKPITPIQPKDTIGNIKDSGIQKPSRDMKSIYNVSFDKDQKVPFPNLQQNKIYAYGDMGKVERRSSQIGSFQGLEDENHVGSGIDVNTLFQDNLMKKGKPTEVEAKKK